MPVPTGQDAQTRSPPPRHEHVKQRSPFGTAVKAKPQNLNALTRIALCALCVRSLCRDRPFFVSSVPLCKSPSFPSAAHLIYVANSLLVPATQNPSTKTAHVFSRNQTKRSETTRNDFPSRTSFLKTGCIQQLRTGQSPTAPERRPT